MELIYIYKSFLISTRITASLAAIVRISAQETIPGHSDSRLFLILSIILKPFKECMLGEAFFSPVSVIVSSSRTDPSHPCVHDSINQIWFSQISINSIVLKCIQQQLKLRKNNDH